MHHQQRRDRPAVVDQQQQHSLRQRLSGPALIASPARTHVQAAAVALLRRVYAKALHPAVAASALAALGFTCTDGGAYRPDQVQAEASAMVTALMQAASDFVDPLS